MSRNIAQMQSDYTLPYINLVNYTIVYFQIKNTFLCENAVYKFYSGFLYKQKFKGDKE